MRIKLLKTILINSVSNTEAVRAGNVVEVDDAEGKELVKTGYAEATTSKATAQARKAPEPENKMAPDATNQAAPNAVTGTVTRTVDNGTTRPSRRGATAGGGRGGKRSSSAKR